MLRLAVLLLGISNRNVFVDLHVLFYFKSNMLSINAYSIAGAKVLQVKKSDKSDSPCYDDFKSTVNRGDFGQIFTILINIFIMMNSILGFIWG